MKTEFLSNLPPVGESVAKLASEGGQFIADNISLYGFFAFCLLFVGSCLIVPVLIYEKYFVNVDDESPVEVNFDNHQVPDSAA